MSSPVKRRALEVARASRGNPDPAVLAEKRRALAEAKLAAYVEQVVSTAPPLTEEQLDRITGLLRGGAA